MTNHVARLYALAVGLAVFFLSWALVAAHPWAAVAAAPEDPRLVALERREDRLRVEAVRVNRSVARRFARYRVELQRRQAEIAAARQANADAAVVAAAATAPAPTAVRVASLPPVTSTRSS